MPHGSIPRRPDPVARTVRLSGLGLALVLGATALIGLVDWGAAADRAAAILPGCGPGWERRWGGVSEGDLMAAVERCLGEPAESRTFAFDSAAVAIEAARYREGTIMGLGPTYGFLLGRVADAAPVEVREWEREEEVDWSWADTTPVFYRVYTSEGIVLHKESEMFTGVVPVY